MYANSQFRQIIIAYLIRRETRWSNH